MLNDQVAIAAQAGADRIPTLTVVTSPGCHFCVDAVAVLTGHAREGRLVLAVCSSDSRDGGRLVAEHRPAVFPLVLVDGSFFSAGRLPRRKLETALQQRAAGDGTC